MSELLNKLKDVDYKLWNEYQQWQQHDNIYDVTALEFILQGCIQRACERRKWIWHHGHGPEMGYVATVNHVNIVKGDSTTEVLLSAYIAAVREEKK